MVLYNVYLWKQKRNKMNEEKVLKVVNDKIFDRITQLIEELSTNEFLEEVSTEVWDENDEPTDFDEEEKIKEIIGSRVIPLLHKMSEYLIGKEIPKN